MSYDARPGFTTNRKGFTLLEIIITISILAVLAVAGLPAMVATMDQRQVSTAADQFRAAHALARTSAQRYGHMSELHLDTSLMTFWVDVDTSGAGQFSTVGNVRDVGSEGVKIASAATLLCFDARGLPIGGGACQTGPFTITFKSKVSGSARSAAVQLTTLGSIVR
jgi:prepilin-type N-terminal cleavage/methylation domain-containing protein